MARQPYNDLVIVVSANDAVADAALLEAEKLLKQKRSTDEGAEFRPKTLRGAVKANPKANVAVISVAGRYAADEARDALQRSLHVLLFSDNVTLEDEITLKKYARDHGLLLMGPGAGTILNGAGLCQRRVKVGQSASCRRRARACRKSARCWRRTASASLRRWHPARPVATLKKTSGGIMMLEGLKAHRLISDKGHHARQQAAVTERG
ncbi:MAG: hypothetical protein U0559_01440 [Anaerolineae bacterium]